jgi:hypothetical protein
MISLPLDIICDIIRFLDEDDETLAQCIATHRTLQYAARRVRYQNVVVRSTRPTLKTDVEDWINAHPDSHVFIKSLYLLGDELSYAEICICKLAAILDLLPTCNGI